MSILLCGYTRTGTRVHAAPVEGERWRSFAHAPRRALCGARVLVSVGRCEFAKTQHTQCARCAALAKGARQ